MLVTHASNSFDFRLPLDQPARPRQPATPSIVLTFSLPSSKVEAWRRFCQELAGSRRMLYADSRRRLGVTREQMILRDTPLGSTATTTLEAPDMARVLGELILSPLPFESWYRERLEELHGVRLTGAQPWMRAAELIQARELMFDWRKS